MATYYVDSLYTGTISNGSINTPWKTLAQVRAAKASIHAGDSILFRRGCTFVGTLLWSNYQSSGFPSGTSTQPISFGDYGVSTELPKFEYPTGTGVGDEYRNCFTFEDVNYINFYNLRFCDDTNIVGVDDKITPGQMTTGIVIGNYPTEKAVGFNISGCEFDKIGQGVVIIGNHNLVTGCRFTNLKNVKNTNTGGDYGAVGVTITGPSNTITKNYFKGAWAESTYFKWNGGACEVYAGNEHSTGGSYDCSNNEISYNTIVDCGGVCEFGGPPSSANIANDCKFYFNKIINCGQNSYTNLNSSFGIQVSNMMWYNNVIVENNLSRFSGVKAASGGHLGDGLSAPVYAGVTADSLIFQVGGSPTASTVYNLKNNVFVISTGMHVSNTNTKVAHDYNVFKMGTPNTEGFTRNTHDIATSAALFVDQISSDPELWDYAPATGSPIIGAGTSVGILLDFIGNTIDNAGSINDGIIQSAGAVVPPPPIPEGYVYLISKRNTSCPNTFTGGCSIGFQGANLPVQYKIEGGVYQDSGTFTGLGKGTFLFYVKDAAGFIYPTNGSFKVSIPSSRKRNC